MAMVRFTRRNLRLLYDTLDQLLEAMGRALVTPELLPLFLSPMVNRLVAYDVQVRVVNGVWGNVKVWGASICPIAYALNRLYVMSHPNLIERVLASILTCPVASALLQSGHPCPTPHHRTSTCSLCWMCWPPFSPAL